jgi:gliding motility-associated-like protein
LNRILIILQIGIRFKQSASNCPRKLCVYNNALSVLFLKTPQNSTIGIYSFKIYDRWGGQVFGTDSPEIGWDGNIDGVQSPAGVYFYTLRIRGSDDSLRSYNGQVQLIR